MRQYLMTLAFDGKDFCGWQVQKNGESVCAAVQQAVSTILRERPDIVGCGRTDAGVHALGYRAAFKTGQTLKPERFLRSFNAVAPASIRALAMEEVPEDFHARYSAEKKTYEYRIYRFHCLPPLYAGTAYLCPLPLDLDAMRAAAGVLTGRHDFTAFHAATGKAEEDCVRELYAIELLEDGPMLTIRMSGNGFLYKMARNIAGTLLDAGLGKMTADEVSAALLSRDHAAAGRTLPAYGLFLRNVEYREEEE